MRVRRRRKGGGSGESVGDYGIFLVVTKVYDRRDLVYSGASSPRRVKMQIRCIFCSIPVELCIP